jgi:hypothetical protein
MCFYEANYVSIFYLGKYLAKASVSQGYPRFVLVRPARAAALDSSKDELLQEFKDNGIHILAIKDSLLFSIIRVIFFDYCDIRINTLFIMI